MKHENTHHLELQSAAIGIHAPVEHPLAGSEYSEVSSEHLDSSSEHSAVHDPVNRPAHYTAHPSGIECIQITEHMGFNLGNALKYIWRCDLKQDAIEDLKKAKWYIEREIAKREKAQ